MPRPTTLLRSRARAVLDDPVAAALEAELARVGADLIVMATHGRTGLSRAWLGSVADRLVRRSERAPGA